MNTHYSLKKYMLVACSLLAFLLTVGLNSATAQIGCMNSDACNYDVANLTTDNSCYFIGSPCDDLSASTINDKYTDCLTCAGTAVVLGCMDNTTPACNYNPLANVSANCKYTNDVCSDGVDATINDKLDVDCTCAGVQAVVGCMDNTKCNYNHSANVPGPCLGAFTSATECWSCSQTIGTVVNGQVVNVSGSWGDGNGMLEDNDINQNGECDNTEVVGCKNLMACNFNIAATVEYTFLGETSPCVFDTEACSFCAKLDLWGNPFFYDSTSLDANGDATGNVLQIDSDGNAIGGIAVLTHPLYQVVNGDLDGNGTCDVSEIYGCKDEEACNYNELATSDTAYVFPICLPEGECGCSGPINDGTGTPLALPASDCDCFGAKLDSIGACLLTSHEDFCLTDIDNDGICDDNGEDPCLTAGEYPDECGVCNGAGIPVGDCDCAGNVADAIGDCDGACTADVNNNNLCDDAEVQGCLDSSACNYGEDGLGNVVVATLHDATNCWYLDECGTCNGSGIAEGMCDCLGHELDQCGVCNGPCDVDINNNDLDDDDEVRGCTDPLSCTFNPAATFDPSTHGVFEDVCKFEGACGKCGGPGILNPNHCDCFGNTMDAMGVCGGTCSADYDQDGICDDVDICIGEPGDLYMPDHCGNCYICLSDANNDGVCDEFEAGGVTEADYGNAAITGFDCGCFNQPTSGCNCTLDAATALYIVNYPEPGKDCNGTCIHGTDPNNPALCMIYENSSVTVLTTPTKDVRTSNKSFRKVNTHENEQWMANIDSLHARASDNLDHITKSGGADSLTIQHRIRDKGELLVEGMTYLQDSLTVGKGAFVTGDVEVGGNLLVNGYARIVGTTFSEGGLETTTIAMSGGLDVGGTITGADSLIINGFASFHDTLRVEDEISVGLQNQIVMDSTGAMTFDQGLVREDLQVRDSLIVNSADIGGNLKVNTTFFTVDAATGNTASRGTLNVTGATTLGSTLDVSNNLRVYNNTIERFKVDASSGNTAVGGTLSVTGNSILSANATVTGILTVTGTTALTSAANLGSTLGVTGATTLSNTLGVSGLTSLSGGLSVLGATSTTTFAGPITASSSLTVNGNFHHNVGGAPGTFFHSKANSFLVGHDAMNVPDYASYQMVVDGTGPNANNNGIVIRSNSPSPNNSTNFMTFMNSAGTVVGRIEGQQIHELWTQEEFVQEFTSKSAELGFAIWNQILAGKDVAEVSVEVATYVAAGVAAVIPGAGLTDSDVAEGISFGISGAAASAKVVIAGATLGARVAAGLMAVTSYASWIGVKLSGTGVVYESGSGDYAEWLEKSNLLDHFSPGDIVGTRGGKISFNTDDSEHNLVISTAPAMLGNSPNGSNENFEKVAFLGQVPIQILGEVQVGDYIIPSGDHDGFGIAISPENITLNQVSEIVAVAWEDGKGRLFNSINCSIGLDNRSTRLLIETVNQRMDEMQLAYAESLSLIHLEIAQIKALILEPDALKMSQSNYAQDHFNKAEKTMKPVDPSRSIESIEGSAQVVTSTVNTERANATVSRIGDVEWNNLCCEETERLCEKYVEEALANAAVVTKEDYEESMNILSENLQDYQAQLDLQSDSDRPSLIGAFKPEYPIAEEVLALTSTISFAILQIITHPSNLQDGFRNERAKMMEQRNKAGDVYFVDKFPPGSAAEAHALAECRKTAQEELFKMYPFMKRYIH